MLFAWIYPPGFTPRDLPYNDLQLSTSTINLHSMVIISHLPTLERNAQGRH